MPAPFLPEVEVEAGGGVEASFPGVSSTCVVFDTGDEETFPGGLLLFCTRTRADEAQRFVTGVRAEETGDDDRRFCKDRGVFAASPELGSS